MSVNTIHVTHGVSFPSGLFVSQLEDATPSAVLEELVAFAAGHPQPLFTGVRTQRPEITFASPQLKGILDLLGLFGVSTAAGNTDLYLKKVTDLGVREADASLVHLRLRAAQGYAYWTGIEASQGQEAQVNARFVATYDGTNAPLVAAGGVALVGTPTAAEQFTLGPVKLNGSFLTGLRRWSLDLAVETMEELADGDTYPTFFAVKAIAPVLTLSGVEETLWNSLTTGGTAITALVAYLRRKVPDGITYADGALQHIAFTATNGIALPVRSTGGRNEPREKEVRCVLRAASAAANVLAINTATTIT